MSIADHCLAARQVTEGDGVASFMTDDGFLVTQANGSPYDGLEAVQVPDLHGVVVAGGGDPPVGQFYQASTLLVWPV